MSSGEKQKRESLASAVNDLFLWLSQGENELKVSKANNSIPSNNPSNQATVPVSDSKHHSVFSSRNNKTDRDRDRSTQMSQNSFNTINNTHVKPDLPTDIFVVKEEDNSENFVEEAEIVSGL
jgi:hypothetical protein